MTLPTRLRVTLVTLGLMLCTALAPSAARAARPKSPGPRLCEVARGLKEPPLTEVCAGITYLGLGTFAGLGLIPSGMELLKAVHEKAEGREDLAAPRHFFAYDVFIVSVSQDSATRGWDLVLRTAAALRSLKHAHANAYSFITSTLRYPAAPALPTSPWKNRLDKIFISFDRTPLDIAASTTLLGRSTAARGVSLYTNYALLSIDAVTILGGETERGGSQLIYALPTAEANYRAYMADGLLFSLVHEMVHLSITHLNSTSRLANAIYFARDSPGARDAEEAVANETALAWMGDGLGPRMRQAVRDIQTGLVTKDRVREWLRVWKALEDPSPGHLVIPE